VFEIFAHNEPGPGGCNQSGKSDPVFCSTAPCPGGGDCTLSWGYWKTHGPEGCNPPGKENMWPVSSLNVGGVVLNEGQICDILQTNPGACNKQGLSNGGSNAVIILEHQLIGAMFNLANGAIPCPFVATAIQQANAALAGHVNDCVGSSTPDGQAMVELAGLLAAYNSDICECPTGQPAQSSATVPSTTTKASWGKVKSIYR
jgi:hypothetical protein